MARWQRESCSRGYPRLIFYAREVIKRTAEIGDPDRYSVEESFTNWSCDSNLLLPIGDWEYRYSIRELLSRHWGFYFDRSKPCRNLLSVHIVRDREIDREIERQAGASNFRQSTHPRQQVTRAGSASITCSSVRHSRKRHRQSTWKGRKEKCTREISTRIQRGWLSFATSCSNTKTKQVKSRNTKSSVITETRNRQKKVDGRTKL